MYSQKILLFINTIFHFKKSRKMQTTNSYYSVTNTYLRKIEKLLFQIFLSSWRAICHTKFSKKTCVCKGMCHPIVFLGRVEGCCFPWKKQSPHRLCIKKSIQSHVKMYAKGQMAV